MYRFYRIFFNFCKVVFEYLKGEIFEFYLYENVISCFIFLENEMSVY